MDAFPIYDFSQMPLALETDLVAFSGKVESSLTEGAFLDAFDLGSGITPPKNSGRGDSNPISFAPFFSLQNTNYPHPDMEFTSPNTSFGQNILGTQERRDFPDGHATIIPVESQAPGIDHLVRWSEEVDGASMEIGRQRYERSSSVNEESAAYCPGHSQLSFTTSTSQPVPIVLPASGTELKPSGLKKEWLSREAVRNPMMSKRIRQRSPSIRSHVEISRRGNSMRKRNASCDIPAGRNIKNIDELISQSTNEQEIKELKQQKRLLRNRQAALDSRQRKRLYTEQLEEEKKKLIDLASRQQDDLNHAEMRISDCVRKEAHWRHKYEILRLESEQILRQREIECSELRNQISVLMRRPEFLALDRISVSTPGSRMNYNYVDIERTSTKEA